MILQTLKEFGTIAFEKQPRLRFLPNSKLHQLSYPELNTTLQNWHAWITFTFGYIRTKFHLDQVSGFWDMQTVSFGVSLILWPWVKVKGHWKWCTLVVLIESYNHTKFEEARYHSLPKSPNVKVSDKFQCTSIISPCMQISQTKLIYMRYGWCTLYPYQVSCWWHAQFLRYCNFLFWAYADPVTYIKVKGHQQWYSCVELNGGYNHTKFDLTRYHSLREKSNIPQCQQTDTQTDTHTDRHTDTDKNITPFRLRLTG